MTTSRFHTPLRFGAVGLAVTCLTTVAHAASSAEMYTSQSYFYGRFSARIQFAAGDGVVSSFFLWKDGSEKSGTFWNELDFEKLGADCHLETNAYFGNPAAVHSKKEQLAANLCSGFHTYTYEWTPDYIAWIVDGAEIRRETGTTAAAYRENATDGMQIRFNIWPGDATFGGNFSPTILPVHEYINWVEYSSYADGAFKVEWRDDFDATSLDSRWLTGSWESPKNLSTHSPANINLVGGYAVLSLTADDATGAAGAAPKDDATATPGAGGASGAGRGGGGGNGMPATGGAGGGGRTGEASGGGGAGATAGADGAGRGGAGDDRTQATGGAAAAGRADGATGGKSSGAGTASGGSKAAGMGGGSSVSGASGTGGKSKPGTHEAGGASDAESTTDEVRSGGCALVTPFAHRQENRVALFAAVVGAALCGRRRTRARSSRTVEKQNGH